ncbi:MAG: DNA polymerase III subunit gamma/tau, partial [Xanthomonadales bacterium]|nr:DNA polymerase III subunit gamma/tau [Xanthomonadales bacterium]
MSYQVLARKWRPHRFSELVGQEHVVRALSNALDSNRIHHAYLFTGTRGVGKTTIARIFAKSLNCERGQSADPCGECAVCTAVDAGRFIDLLEIDAASNTGVDDVREMIENAQYAPSRGRFKVYLIDEVHMLSKSAFNALLKTLEEPPPHVKFLLATTDPQKLPVTVLSRCLKFNLKHLLASQMIGQMRHILEAEQVDFEDSALTDIAHAADGSMRDALSLLDQAIAYGGGKLAAHDTRAMLGTVDAGGVQALLNALADGDGGALLAEADRIATFAPDFGGVLGQLAAAFHRIQIRQLVPDYRDDDAPMADGIDALAQRLDAQEVQLYYHIATTGGRELQLAPDAQSGFAMILLRMLAFRPQTEAPSGKPRAPAPSSAVKPLSATKQAASPVMSAAQASAPSAASGVAEASRPLASVPVAGDSAAWARLIDEADLRGPVGQLARHALLDKIDGNGWTLVIQPAHTDLAVEPFVGALQKTLSTVTGRPLKLHFKTSSHVTGTPAQQSAQRRDERQAAAEQSIHNDPVVQQLQTELGAR